MNDMVIVKGSTLIYSSYRRELKKSGKNGDLYELFVWYFHMMDYLG